MNKEEVIALAREAGFEDWAVYGRIESKEECLKRFASLVAAAEREECAYLAEMCDDVSIAQFIRARGNDES